MPDTIREFLVGLGFKTDEASLGRFTRAIEGATLRAKLLGDAIEGMATSAYESVTKTADNFERLYWQSQRLATSVSSIRAFSYAVSQLGGDAAQANSSLEGFGNFLKYHPGTRSLIGGRVGHSIEGEDAGKVLDEVGSYLRTLSKPQQKLQATQMHLDDLTYNAVINPGFHKWYSEELDRGNAAGVGKTAEDSVKLEQSLRGLNQAVDDLKSKAIDPLIPALKGIADWLDGWLKAHPAEAQKAALPVMGAGVGATGGGALGFLFGGGPIGALVGSAVGGMVGGDVGGIVGAANESRSPSDDLSIGGTPPAPDYAGAQKRWNQFWGKVWGGIKGGLGRFGSMGIEPADADDLPVGIGPQWNGINANLPTGGAGGAAPASAPHVNGSPISNSNPMPVRLVEDTTNGGSGGGGFGGWVKSLFGGASSGGEIGGSTGGWSGKGNAGVGGWWTPERMKYAVDRLVKEAGLTPEGAAGLVARWAAIEAPGGPTSVNSKSGATGIAQGLGARRMGYTGTYEEQVTNAIRELNGAEKRAGDILRHATTAAEAARGASAFERAEGYNSISGADNFTNATPVEKVIKAIAGLGQPKGAVSSSPNKGGSLADNLPGMTDAENESPTKGFVWVADPSNPNGGDWVMPKHGKSKVNTGANWPSAPSAWGGIESLLPVGGGASSVKNNNVSSSVVNHIHVETSDPATAAAMVGDHIDRTAQHIATNLQGAVQ